MSLIIYPYRRDTSTDEIIFLDEYVKQPHNEIFGFESWRYSVWGSNVLESLECKVLSKLKEENIYAEGEILTQLGVEFERILSSLENIQDALQISPNLIKFRVTNGIEAIRIAREYPKGGVVIS